MTDQLFPLFGCWRETFEQITESLRTLVRKRSLEPQQLVAVAKLTYAFERLPNPTIGLGIQSSLIFRHDSGSGSLYLSHHGERIEVGYLDCFRDPGPMHLESEFSRHVLIAEVGIGHNRKYCDPIEVMIELEDWLYEWSSRIADSAYLFEIDDDCDEDDWNQPQHAQGWEMLPDGC